MRTKHTNIVRYEGDLVTLTITTEQESEHRATNTYEIETTVNYMKLEPSEFAQLRDIFKAMGGYDE